MESMRPITIFFLCLVLYVLKNDAPIYTPTVVALVRSDTITKVLTPNLESLLFFFKVYFCVKMKLNNKHMFAFSYHS